MRLSAALSVAMLATTSCGKVMQDGRPAAGGSGPGSSEAGVAGDDGVADGATGDDGVADGAANVPQIFSPMRLRKNSDSLFFLAYTKPNLEGWALVRARKESGELAVVIENDDLSAFAVDDHAVYFALYKYPACGEGPCDPGSGLLQSIPVEGGSVSTLAQFHGAPGEIVVDAEWIWFTSADGIQRLPITGGSVKALFKTGTLIASNAGRLDYYRSEVATELHSLEIATGDDTLVASISGSLGTVIDRGSNLYYVDAFGDGDIWQVAETGGTPKKILNQASGAFDVAGQLYYLIGDCPDGAVIRADVSTGDRTPVVTGLCNQSELLLDGKFAEILEWQGVEAGSPGAVGIFPLP